VKIGGGQKLFLEHLGHIISSLKFQQTIEKDHDTACKNRIALTILEDLQTRYSP